MTRITATAHRRKETRIHDLRLVPAGLAVPARPCRPSLRRQLLTNLDPHAARLVSIVGRWRIAVVGGIAVSVVAVPVISVSVVAVPVIAISVIAGSVVAVSVVAVSVSIVGGRLVVGCAVGIRSPAIGVGRRVVIAGGRRCIGRWRHKDLHRRTVAVGRRRDVVVDRRRWVGAAGPAAPVAGGGGLCGGDREGRQRGAQANDDVLAHSLTPLAVCRSTSVRLLTDDTGPPIPHSGQTLGSRGDTPELWPAACATNRSGPGLGSTCNLAQRE